MAPAGVLSRLVRIARTSTTEAVVLRSLRYSEADRILHLYTEDRGRVGAIAKGARKTRSRFGGRLEPLSHVELVLHEGRGELQTVTGASLVRSHAKVRDDARRSAVGLVAAEAVLRLFPEQERNDRVFTALTRFLDLLDEADGGPASRRARPARSRLPAEAAVARGLPAARGQLRRVRRRRADHRLLATGRRSGLRRLRKRLPLPFRLTGWRRSTGCSGCRSSDAHEADVSERGARDALAVVSASYEFHGGFRLRTLSA